MRRKLAIAVCSALFLAGPCIAQDGPVKDYLFSMRVLAGETVIGRPKIQASAGQAATVVLAGGYSIRVMAMPDARQSGHVLLTSDVTIKSAGAQRTQSSTLSLRPDEKTIFTFPPQTDVTSAPVRIEISAANN